MRAPSVLSAVLSLASAAFVVSCGGGTPPPKALPADMPKEHHCGEAGKVQQHTLDPHEDGATHAFVPCSKSGKGDYAGAIRIESNPDGIHVVIDATDDDFNHGALGSDLKGRDAVIVYPRGKGSKAIEVPLHKTDKGYHGEITIPYEELEKLHDEGTKLQVTVYDHDKDHADKHEELHVEVAVSTGKSCEKAIDENPQSLDMGKKGEKKPDLTDAQLGAPMKTSAFFSHCGLRDNENAEICVAVKEGKALGVSVGVAPSNRKTAACIDRAARKLHWPASDKLDVVHQKF